MPSQRKHSRESHKMKGRIVVFSIVGCPHCLRAKNKLSELGLEYKEISLDSFPQMRDEVKKLTGGKSTVPQIFFNDYYVGGNDELQKLVKDRDQFDELVDRVKNEKPGPKAPTIPDPETAVDFGKNEEFVCEPDEYANLVEDLRKSGIIKDNKTGLFSKQRNTFKGRDFIEWIMDKRDISERAARELGQELVDRHFGKNLRGGNEKREEFEDEGLYRLVEDDETKALNSGPMSDCAPVDGDDLGELMRRQILKLYDKHLHGGGKGVDYAKMAKDSLFDEYSNLTLELRRVDVGKMTRDQRLAFFINIYNALVIHANIELGPPTNTWQRYKFFNTASYIIGGELYSLQDIENGVLRGNNKGVGMFRKPFSSEDPRLKVALDPGEPLIHFALNCGAKSCPPIKTFSSKGIKGELKVASESFLETPDGVEVDVAGKEVKLTQIFKWYRVDFGGPNEQIVDWISKHMAQGEKLDRLSKVMASGSYKISFMPYDWGTNSKED